jgi:hypothetical protein
MTNMNTNSESVIAPESRAAMHEGVLLPASEKENS